MEQEEKETMACHENVDTKIYLVLFSLHWPIRKGTKLPGGFNQSSVAVWSVYQQNAEAGSGEMDVDGKEAGELTSR